MAATWSYSAHRLMHLCQRQLVFAQIVASHNARHPERREAYILKQLQDLPRWQGSLAHEVLATEFLSAVRNRRNISPLTLCTAASVLAEQQLAFSAGRRYREAGVTKESTGSRYCALYEHEQGIEIHPERLAEVMGRVALCFDNLFEHLEFPRAIYAGSDHKAEERVTFFVDDVLLTAWLDLVHRRPDGGITIIDWKVAESETSDYTYQLYTYALAVLRNPLGRGLSPGDIHLYEANLLKNEIRRYTVTDERIDATEDFVYRSLVELQTLIGGVKFEELHLDDYEVAEKAATCQHCSFHPLCLRSFLNGLHPEKAEMVQLRLL